jgi:hypothetical protein
MGQCDHFQDRNSGASGPLPGYNPGIGAGREVRYFEPGPQHRSSSPGRISPELAGGQGVRRRSEQREGPRRAGTAVRLTSLGKRRPRVSQSASSQHSGHSRGSIRHQRRTSKSATQVVKLSQGPTRPQTTLVPTELRSRQLGVAGQRPISPSVRAGSSLRQPLDFLQHAGIGKVSTGQAHPTTVCHHHGASLASNGMALYYNQARQVVTH